MTAFRKVLPPLQGGLGGDYLSCFFIIFLFCRPARNPVAQEILPNRRTEGMGGRDKKMIYSDLTVCLLSAEAGRKKRFSPPPYPLCLKKNGGIKEETTCFVGIIHKTHLLPPHPSHLTSQIVGHLHTTATYLSPHPSLSVAALFPICRRYVPCLSFGIVVTCWVPGCPMFPTNIL